MTTIYLNVWDGEQFNRIGLRDKQTFTVQISRNTGEGSIRTVNTYTRCGGMIIQESESCGSDCDGRIDTYSRREWDGKDVWFNPNNVELPNWKYASRY